MRVQELTRGTNLSFLRPGNCRLHVAHRRPELGVDFGREPAPSGGKLFSAGERRLWSAGGSWARVEVAAKVVFSGTDSSPRIELSLARLVKSKSGHSSTLAVLGVELEWDRGTQIARFLSV